MLESLQALPDAVRKALFGLLAVLLLVLGFLATRGGGADASATPAGSARPGAGQPAAPATGPEQTSEPASVPAQTVTAPSAAPEPQVDLTLPLTNEQMQEPAQVAMRFIEQYTSYRYDQNDDAWLGEIRSLLSRNASFDPVEGLPPATLAAELAAQQKVSESKPSGLRVTYLAEDSIGFAVSAVVTSTTASGSTSETVVYTLVLDRVDNSWGVMSVNRVGAADGPGNGE